MGNIRMVSKSTAEMIMLTPCSSALGCGRAEESPLAPQTKGSQRRRVAIVGGGFGGLAAAQKLRRADVDVTLVDRTNHHLFQPLLYQLAAGRHLPLASAPPRSAPALSERQHDVPDGRGHRRGRQSAGR